MMVRFTVMVMRGVAALLLLGALREPLLRGAARWWIVDEVPVVSDAIVVLGGGEDYRPFAAARLWKAGMAPVILVPDVRLHATEAMGLRPGTTEVILGVLRAEGVPDGAVVKIGKGVTSTREEAAAVNEWAMGVGKAKPSLVIPTDPFPTRRTNWLFEKTIPGCSALVVRIDPLSMDAERWWTSEMGLISFQNEVIKYLFYRVRY